MHVQKASIKPLIDLKAALVEVGKLIFFNERMSSEEEIQSAWKQVMQVLNSDPVQHYMGSYRRVASILPTVRRDMDYDNTYVVGLERALECLDRADMALTWEGSRSPSFVRNFKLVYTPVSQMEMGHTVLDNMFSSYRGD